MNSVDKARIDALLAEVERLKTALCEVRDVLGDEKSLEQARIIHAWRIAKGVLEDVVEDVYCGCGHLASDHFAAPLHRDPNRVGCRGKNGSLWGCGCTEFRSVGGR